MGKHEYCICQKCKGNGYCESQSSQLFSCHFFVKKDSSQPWKNPNKDVFDKMVELRKKGKIQL